MTVAIYLLNLLIESNGNAMRVADRLMIVRIHNIYGTHYARCDVTTMNVICFCRRIAE